MRVIESNDYDREFPENFTWGHLDSPKLASLGSIVAAHVLEDLKTFDRLYVPGLRCALNHIADMGEV